MITEDYVSFETAKLLKERGFDGDINFWYNENGNEIFFQQKYDLMYNWRVRQGMEIYQCPTLQMAMKWLREVHNIHIQVITICEDYKAFPPEYYIYISSTVDGKNLVDYKSGDNGVIENGLPRDFKNYEEAVEAAIKYCLEKLI